MAFLVIQKIPTGSVNHSDQVLYFGSNPHYIKLKVTNDSFVSVGPMPKKSKKPRNSGFKIIDQLDGMFKPTIKQTKKPEPEIDYSYPPTPPVFKSAFADRRKYKS